MKNQNSSTWADGLFQGYGETPQFKPTPKISFYQTQQRIQTTSTAGSYQTPLVTTHPTQEHR